MEAIAKETGRLPPALQNRPELPDHLQLYWQAFQVLTLSRPTNGFSVGAIPLSEILAYAELLGIQGLEAREDLVRFIRAMDVAYLRHVLSKPKADA